MNKMKELQAPETVKKRRAINQRIIARMIDDKPYYSIRYFDLDDCRWHVGYSSYKLEFVVEWLRTCFDIVDTKSGWIPVSERLPKTEGKNEWVKCDVTVIRSHWPTSSYDYCDSPYDEFYVTGAIYNVSQKIWNLSNEIQLNALIDIEDAPLNGDYVIALQPLPEPYQNDEQEEKR